METLDKLAVDPAWPERPEGWRHDAGVPEEAFAVPFTMFDGLTLIGWTIIAQVVVAIPAFALGIDPEIPVQGLVLTVAIQIATMAGVVGWLAFRGAFSWRLLGPIRPGWRHVGYGVGLGVVGFFLVLVAAKMFDSVFGPFPEPTQGLLTYDYSNGVLVFLLILVTVVLAPIIEETIFRGVMFQATRRKLGMFPGLIVSSLLFTFVHVEVLNSPPAVVGLLVLALWLAAIMHQTGSLITNIVAHGTYNLIVVVITISAVASKQIG